MSLGERIGEVLWSELPGMFRGFFAGYMNNCWHLDSHMFWGYPHGTFFPLPPPAAVTVGKQYATPHLPSSIDVCFCERCTAICLTKPNPAAHFEISDTYDDEAFWQILQCTLLGAREMEGGDPFRSLMLRARVWETAVLQSDMLELWS